MWIDRGIPYDDRKVVLAVVSAHLKQLATRLDAQSQMAMDNLTHQVLQPSWVCA